MTEESHTGQNEVGQNATGLHTPRVTTERLRRFARWQLLLVSGVVGALTVTLLNESVRRVVPHAPRMDVIGERALSRTLDAAGLKPPRGKALYRWTMLGDLVSNSLYYALVGLGSPAGALPRGGALGLAAGLGAVVLPRPLGLGRQPNEQSPVTPLLTVAWYLAGGLSAAAVYRSMSRAETGNG